MRCWPARCRSLSAAVIGVVQSRHRAGWFSQALTPACPLQSGFLGGGLIDGPPAAGGWLRFLLPLGVLPRGMQGFHLLHGVWSLSRNHEAGSPRRSAPSYGHLLGDGGQCLSLVRCCGFPIWVLLHRLRPSPSLKRPAARCAAVQLPCVPDAAVTLQ